ncbi:MAG TPA: methyltransferase, partial [Rhodococcus sp. (in: high G+C Gram-positive bacteria)]|nr:methyltransferase [Rhodococcus sp. (in: high G+C Gram-positive bacteria)]
DPAARDSTVLAVREAARAISQDDRLAPVVLPLGDGLLCAVRMS